MPSKKNIIAGVDEVGRGSWIGPVYSAAVILKKGINIKLLKDSKQISIKKRNQLLRSKQQFTKLVNDISGRLRTWK